MKKTININLAGLLFHIDEDAYLKLSDYLAAIRQSLGTTDGYEEILHEIEARIAELFSEKLPSSQHVIGMKELNEVILIMGQPEDYAAETESFTEEENAKTDFHDFERNYRRLYRDEDDKWIGGVSSGIAHYFGIDPLWIRSIWAILLIAGVGSPILIYCILWILIPAAVTTADKLRMHGKPINISNIERKFREGFDNVTSKMKDVDYDKYGNQIKTGTSQFFNSLGRFLSSVLQVFGKFLGILLIIISISALASLILSFVGIGSFGYIDPIQYWNYFPMAMANDFLPSWLFFSALFFAIGIPFFALFVLGLKLIIPNLRPIYKILSLSLWSLWILSIVLLIFIGIDYSKEKAVLGNSVNEKEIRIKNSDTIRLAIKNDHYYGLEPLQKSGFSVGVDKQNNPVLLSRNIGISIQSTTDSIGKIIIDRKARGRDFISARKRAEIIEYHFDISENEILLDPLFMVPEDQKFNDHHLKIIITLPQNTIIFPEKHISSFIEQGILKRTNHSNYYQIENSRAVCISCPGNDSVVPESDSIPSPNKRVEEDWEIEVLKQF